MKLKFIALLHLLVMMSCQNQKGAYVCPPCDLKCDKLSFSEAGTCPHCQMKLILKTEQMSDLKLEVNKIEIKTGSGQFLIEGGFDKNKTIWVHYHKPKKFNPNSKVIFVVPGAGRNGGDYCDAWKNASEKYNVLVLSLEYSQKHYPEFWSYNLGGMIYDVDVQNETFKINQDPKQWIFEDFDRIFDAVKGALNLTSNNYDMFGHSAGGQILHRFAIFKPENNADRILASNSGWYTVPTISERFPYGIRNIRESVQRLDFSKNLILFLGEKDDASETRGHLRRSPEVDKQGHHRLERGVYFYHASKHIATASNAEFNWKLEIVSNIGHDYREMSDRAAKYLYEKKGKE